MSKLTAGVVTILLGADRQEYYLRTSARAIQAISDLDGGMVNVLVRLKRMDFGAYVAVVKHGLNADAELAKRLPRLVYEATMPELVEPLVKYMTLLMNGGKEPAPPKKEPDGEEEEGGTEEDEGNGGAADAA